MLGMLFLMQYLQKQEEKKNPSSLGAEEVGNNRFLKGMSFRVFQ